MVIQNFESDRDKRFVSLQSLIGREILVERFTVLSGKALIR
jgi:hypothetical protein